MNVHYWAVGATTRGYLPLTHTQISNHLLADWVPSLPASLGTAIFGWPQHLTELVTHSARTHLAVHPLLRATERQWKGVLSWMLGVAGTRQVLEQEGYRWIAPLSAFYPNAKRVNTPRWHANFSNGVLTASGDPTVPAKLKPDYVAIRTSSQNAAVLEWAAVESKGTARSLANLTNCPAPWYNQAHNVRLFANGARVAISRHMVVATRSYTDGSNASTRCLQVRAWNSQDSEEISPPPIAAVEVAAAHLFGLCRNLGLAENAHLLGSANWRMKEAGSRPVARADSQLAVELQFADEARTVSTIRRDGEPLKKATYEPRPRDLVAAEAELQEYVASDAWPEDVQVSGGTDADRLLGARIAVEVERRPIYVELHPSIINLIRVLGRAESQEEAIKAFEVANRALDARSRLPLEELSLGRVSEVSAGVRVRD